MQVLVMSVRLYAPWVQSLKQKRMEVKSLTARMRHRFNVSVCEVGEQDVHKTIVLAVAAVCGDTQQADSIAEHIISYITANSEAEITEIERELF